MLIYSIIDNNLLYNVYVLVYVKFYIDFYKIGSVCGFINISEINKRHGSSLNFFEPAYVKGRDLIVDYKEIFQNMESIISYL
jgi:hypothetical protein